MLLQKKHVLPNMLPLLAYCGFGLLLLLAIVLRASLYPIETSDYTIFVSRWSDFIQTHGGFATFKYNFSNYNPPYLYLLALATYLPIPKLIAVKTLSVVFDGVLAFFTYLIVSMKYRRSYAAMSAALVLAFAPTIFINSAAWGQCDAIFLLSTPLLCGSYHAVVLTAQLCAIPHTDADRAFALRGSCRPRNRYYYLC